MTFAWIAVGIKYPGEIGKEMEPDLLVQWVCAVLTCSGRILVMTCLVKGISMPARP